MWVIEVYSNKILQFLTGVRSVIMFMKLLVVVVI